MISELKHTYETLKGSLQALCNHLNAEQPAHHIPLTDSEASLATPLQWSCELLSDLTYQSGADGRLTRSRHGIIIATPRTQSMVQYVNAQKDAFAHQVRQISLESEQLWKEASSELAAQPLPFRQGLSQSGLNRLHLKQCTRKIPLLAEKPVKVGFSWYSHGRSITRISHQEAERLLLELGEHKTHIQVQLATLSTLKTATPLARVQTLAPVVRANIVFEHGRRAMNCPLPLFVPDTNAHGELPHIRDVSLEAPEGRRRKMREDDRISPEPLLPSIRVHTYRS